MTALITDTMVAAGAKAVMETKWRYRNQPLELNSAHEDHTYDYACAVCRPDLDNGAQRIARAILEAALTTGENTISTPTLTGRSAADC